MGVMNVGGSCPPPAAKTSAPAQGEVVEVARRLAGSAESDLIDGTCGLDSTSNVSDCQNGDHGSCGNACCSLTVTLTVSATEAYNVLSSSFDTGGPDGQFTKNPMAEGGFGFANLTGLPPVSSGFGSGDAFIGQLNHMTTGGKYHFNDTVNFNIVDSEGGATMNAFSTSLIGGAYGDAGQSYKNIIMALKGSNSNGWSAASVMNVGGSCPPAAAKTSAPAQGEVVEVARR